MNIDKLLKEYINDTSSASKRLKNLEKLQKEYPEHEGIKLLISANKRLEKMQREIL